MPFRFGYNLSRAACSSQLIAGRKALQPASLRAFTTSCRLHDVAAKNHYERLNIRHDATPAEIKK
jgi:mannosyl-oligosaccharide alpha-1,2-mannosidase